MSLPIDGVDPNTLADGERVVITWDGGNGPHEYVVKVEHGIRYAYADLPGGQMRVAPITAQLVEKLRRVAP